MYWVLLIWFSLASAMDNPALGLENVKYLHVLPGFNNNCLTSGNQVTCSSYRSGAQELIKAIWTPGQGLDLDRLGRLNNALQQVSGKSSGEITFIMGNRPKCQKEIRFIIDREGNFHELIEQLSTVLSSVDRLLGEEEVYLYSDGKIRSEVIPIQKVQTNLICVCSPGTDLFGKYNSDPCQEVLPPPPPQVIPQKENLVTLLTNFFREVGIRPYSDKQGT